ncbi:MAG: DMT family transporter [Candidatus Gastranaerophilaceae bacterium]
MDKITDNKLYIYCNISLLLAAFISGLSFVAQKLGMNYVAPFTFNTLRCFIGCFSLLPMMFLLSKEKYSLKGGIFAGIVLFIAFSINQYCMIYSDAGKAGFITSLYILFVPIIAIFLKHKLSNNVKLSILISLLGLYLLCAKNTFVFDLWDILLLISAFFFALHIIVVSHYSKKSDAIKLSIIQFFTAGVLSLPLMFLFENPDINSIILGWKPILFIGILVTGVAYTLQIFGHKATKPTLATLILSSEAIFAVLGGMIILNETLSIKEIAGCILMFIAIVFSQISNKKGGFDEK